MIAIMIGLAITMNSVTSLPSNGALTSESRSLIRSNTKIASARNWLATKARNAQPSVAQ